MKTPEEIIDAAARDAWCSMRTHHEHILDALDAAGYVIVPKELSEDRRTEFNRVGNWHPEATDTPLIWRDLAKFMGKP